MRCYESSFVKPLRAFVRQGPGLLRGLLQSRGPPDFVDIGPVNKVYNMLVAYDRDDGTFDEHCLRVPDYLWVAEDGLKMQVCFRVLRVASMASRRTCMSPALWLTKL